MHLSQDDLASLVGVSRQYLNELLQRWGREGLVQWKAKGRHIVNLARLEKMAPALEGELLESPSVLRNGHAGH